MKRMIVLLLGLLLLAGCGARDTGGLTQEQIAERMGISRRTLREHLEAIEKKLNKYTANTRH